MAGMNDLLTRYSTLTTCCNDIESAVNILTVVYKLGGTVYICGNGGSAADAEHITGELMKGFLKKRPLIQAEYYKLAQYGDNGLYLAERLQGALPAVAISSMTALMTAVSNDIDSDVAFAQAVWGLAGENDVLFAISTSGNASNVIYAAIAARAKGAKIISLTGETGGELLAYSDVCIRVPETETYKIQELHLPVYHYICAALENAFFEI